MSTSRKNLKRDGFRRYLVGTLAIDKDNPRRWYVAPRDWPRNGFFAHKFSTLRDARRYAESVTGDDWPDDMPKFLRRTSFERRAV